MFWQRWPEQRETDGLPSEARDGGVGAAYGRESKRDSKAGREREKGGMGGRREGGGAAVLRV
jgi:hypothetical protein